MKTRAEVSTEKVRGGFYTPARLVAHALRRLQPLLPSGRPCQVLEPAVGAGAFLEGLVDANVPVADVLALDVDLRAVASSRQQLDRLGLPGRVIHGSALAWSLNAAEMYDAVVGNLPFVRFQFMGEEDRRDALRHGEDLGVSVAGVANLWLPMLLASLRRLRPDGAFCLVLPAECFTGVSAGNARKWLLRETTRLQCDLYPPGSFPDVLQEVIVLSGRRAQGSSEAVRSHLTVAQHAAQHSADDFDEANATVRTHLIANDTASWTSFLLDTRHLDAFTAAMELPVVRKLGDVARFEAAAVTGANGYFCLPDSSVSTLDLYAWTRPLLARVRHSPGLEFTPADLAANVAADRKAHLFDAALAPIPAGHPGLHRYLNAGEAEEIDQRYKCRIRKPWYAVPHIKWGSMFLSKRSHRYPRLILNSTEAVTTDTIYRGRLLVTGVANADVVAAFHNSLTILSAELEGRSFGGGVLELVPSEVARLLLPSVPGMHLELPRLDSLARDAATSPSRSAEETLVEETDLLLIKADLGLTTELMQTLAEARAILLQRRLARTSSTAAGSLACSLAVDEA